MSPKEAYKNALRAAVLRAVAPYGEAAEVKEASSRTGAEWEMEIRPVVQGAASASLTRGGGDTVVVGFGRTFFEAWDDDPVRLAVHVQEVLDAVLAGRFLEAGFGEAFARLALADGSYARVGRFHVP